MPTQRWKQAPVMLPQSRCIFTLFTRSAVDWCRWQKRFTGLPVKLEDVTISSRYSGISASL